MADWTPSRGQNAFQNVGSAGGIGWIAEQLGLWNGNRNYNTNCADQPVNRYELGLIQANEAKDMEIAILKSENFTNSKINELGTQTRAALDAIRTELRDQAVYNATNTATIGCIGNQVQQLQAAFNNLTQVGVPCSNVITRTGCSRGSGDIDINVIVEQIANAFAARMAA